jgi:hypothetical protein
MIHIEKWMIFANLETLKKEMLRNEQLRIIAKENRNDNIE